jgi:hypothetical protein
MFVDSLLGLYHIVALPAAAPLPTTGKLVSRHGFD